jgi:DNA-binding NarL/FixJ family response regulator
VLGIGNCARFGLGECVETKTKRIILVYDFVAWRNLLKTLLMVTAEWQVIGEATTGAEGLRLVHDLNPDLVLLDVFLPDVNGFDFARQLQELVPNIKIAFLTYEPSSEFANAALSTGALAYLLQSDVVSELLPALKAVFAGERFISKNIY